MVWHTGLTKYVEEGPLVRGIENAFRTRADFEDRLLPGAPPAGQGANWQN